MKLNEMAINAYTTSLQRQKNGAPIKVVDILKHCAGEVIEAQEALDLWKNAEVSVKESRDHFAEELADIIICALISAAANHIDIETALNKKMQLNAKRAELQGDKK